MEQASQNVLEPGGGQTFPRDLLPLERGGILIRDYRTLPCRARIIPGETGRPPREPPVRYRANIPTAWLELTLVEGKNRQVRRMTAAGFPTPDSCVSG